ncbi:MULTISPECIES: hypothetical protein [Peribacillus]|uniref:hypothetical protein n=1 Tax=Peribacillus TaxID=2675229 RepID=UPI001F4EA4C4|nr:MULTISPECIES: hypothetical protein [unclassified Peribacillus]MCK1982192.1 hypothetical protein [Peribacillus sp. Aquil_B1]MCK2007456.1 hypothetical protein [Peribacillus sp. Aquil_B8]
MEKQLQELKDYFAYRTGRIPDNVRWIIEKTEEQQKENEQLRAENEKWKRAYHKLDPVGFILNEPLKEENK